jgi:hypothetical protein
MLSRETNCVQHQLHFNPTLHETLIALCQFSQKKLSVQKMCNIKYRSD